MRSIPFLLLLVALTGCQTTNRNQLLVNGNKFEVYDMNKDGFVTKDDLAAYDEKMFNTMDMDKDGSIQKVEYDKFSMLAYAYMMKKNNAPPQAFSQNIGTYSGAVDENFKKLDKNSDKKLSFKEFKNMRESSNKMILGGDLNGDGRVEEKELKASMDAQMLKTLAELKKQMDDAKASSAKKN